MVTQANHPLPPGFRVGEYRIDRQISLGGFSIVYRAFDKNDEYVAIKEYLPNNLALRKEGRVRPDILDEHLPTFRYGMKCFFEEGRSLAALSHPNVIRVLNFFRANNTVYMVMEYEIGRTLQEFIKDEHPLITENFIRNVFTRLLNGLREVHSHKLLHLDIKPSNVYMRNDYDPVLIDFGAARQKTLENESLLLKPMYTPGFAAPEHYRDRDRLGPWSDLYSIGASMYSCLSRSPPQDANDRLKHDRLVPAMERWAGSYSRQLLETIDSCLRLDYLLRPQSAFALQKALTADFSPEAPPPLAPAAGPQDARSLKKTRTVKKTAESPSRWTSLFLFSKPSEPLLQKPARKAGLFNRLAKKKAGKP